VNPTQEKSSRQKIVEDVFGAALWESSAKGFIKCPGYEQHTTQSSSTRECAVFLDEVPTVFCFHQSCAEEIETANRELRHASRQAEAGKGFPTCKKKLTVEQRAWQKEQRRVQAMRVRAAACMPMLLKQNAWTTEQARTESPIPIPENPLEHWSLSLNLFEADEIIWVGNTFDSGEARHAQHFQTTTAWRQLPHAPYPFTCPSIFKAGAYSRSNESVLAHKFLVVESDTLPKADMCSVFRWLNNSIKLRAIVDTAGRSLHGWFECPDQKFLDELKIILPAMGCDPALFKPSQPCRMAGAWREKKIQSLVWFDGGSHA